MKNGRWQARDPKEEFFSSYVYCGNNPVGFVDPDGEDIILYMNAGSLYAKQVTYTGRIFGGIISSEKVLGEVTFSEGRYYLGYKGYTSLYEIVREDYDNELNTQISGFAISTSLDLLSLSLSKATTKLGLLKDLIIPRGIMNITKAGIQTGVAIEDNGEEERSFNWQSLIPIWGTWNAAWNLDEYMKQTYPNLKNEDLLKNAKMREEHWQLKDEEFIKFTKENGTYNYIFK